MAKKTSFGKKIWKIIRWAMILFFGSSVFFTILYRFIPPPLTPLMVIRVFQQLTNGESVTLQKYWMPLDKISNNLEQAVVTSEDNEFLDHYGFDFEAIKKAQEYNANHKKTKGASTISQQTAKNVFLWPQRSWIRKGLEVYFTGLIELLWGKRRIMEVYLNVIEMGDGIYGAEMASQKYFNKPAGKLTKVEAALLAAILPNPRLYSAVKPSPYIQRKQLWILNHMNKVDKVNFGR
ncbi:MAG: monofunctional biosynthetic peptidoglycan transglycosylase [Bacteroidetes bacterium]|nr:monofunctional biosynthetic peptidoglycan transglycosylase [Bacteroidota bacterium]